MGELTLLSLLTFIAGDFCESRQQGTDTLKSVLLAYSKAHDKFGGDNVRKIVSEAPNIEAPAIAVVLTKCPDKL